MVGGAVLTVLSVTGGAGRLGYAGCLTARTALGIGRNTAGTYVTVSSVSVAYPLSLGFIVIGCTVLTVLSVTGGAGRLGYTGCLTARTALGIGSNTAGTYVAVSSVSVAYPLSLGIIVVGGAEVTVLGVTGGAGRLGYTGCLTAAVLCSRLGLFTSTLGADDPVLGSVALKSSLIGVRSCSCRTAYAFSIAIVIVAVSHSRSRLLYTAYRAYDPVLIRITFVFRIIVLDISRCTALVTVGIAIVIIAVRSNRLYRRSANGANRCAGLGAVMIAGSKNVLTRITGRLECSLTLTYRLIVVGGCASRGDKKLGVRIIILTESYRISSIGFAKNDISGFCNLEDTAVYRKINDVAIRCVTCIDHVKGFGRIILNVKLTAVKNDIEYCTELTVTVIPEVDGCRSVSCGNSELGSVEGYIEYLSSCVAFKSACNDGGISNNSITAAARYDVTALNDNIGVYNVGSALISDSLSLRNEEVLSVAVKGILTEVNYKSSADMSKVAVVHISASHRVIASHKYLSALTVSEVTYEEKSCLPKRTCAIILRPYTVSADEQSVTEYRKGILFGICVLIGDLSVFGSYTESVGGYVSALAYCSVNQLSVIGRGKLIRRSYTGGCGKNSILTVLTLADDQGISCTEGGELNLFVAACNEPSAVDGNVHYDLIVLLLGKSKYGRGGISEVNYAVVEGDV